MIRPDLTFRLPDGWSLPKLIDRPTIAGIAFCVALAIVAFIAGPLLGIPAMVGALLLGLAARAALPRIAAETAPGIKYCSTSLLRVGVALLGCKMALNDLAAIGPRAIAIVLVSVAVTIGGGYLLARLWGQPSDIAAISATSVGICGASAALAAATVMPPRDGIERETAAVIVTVSLLGTVVMILYPWLAHILGLHANDTALLLGAAIHDVAQVAGAGFALSPQIGVEAVAIKMVRVACLLPVVLVFGRLLFQHDRAGSRAGTRRMVPLFLIAFLFLAALNSWSLLSHAAAKAGGDAAGWMLAVALGAIGLKTGLADFRATRPALVATLVGQTLLQLATVLLLVYLQG